MTLVPQGPKAAATSTKSNLARIDSYTCPMHADYRSDKPGKCPKCGMTLVPANPPTEGTYDLRITTSPAQIKAHQNLNLRFVIINPKSGAPTRDYIAVHTKLFHLFIVSQDLAIFQHIHPVLQSDGSFTIDTVLPQAGHYKVYADFFPSDGTPQVIQRDLVTAGYDSDLFRSEPHLVPDQLLSRIFDTMRVDAKLDPPTVIAGQPVTITYHLSDATSGEPVGDIRPYLGAWGHTLILSEDQIDYVHSHPSGTIPEDQLETIKGGPDVTFEALLPRPGSYRIWTQFRRGDKLTTVTFTLAAHELE
jgi:hypothetical protein